MYIFFIILKTTHIFGVIINFQFFDIIKFIKENKRTEVLLTFRFSFFHLVRMEKYTLKTTMQIFG